MPAMDRYDLALSGFSHPTGSSIPCEIGPGTTNQNDPIRRHLGDILLFQAGYIWVDRGLNEQPLGWNVPKDTFEHFVGEEVAVHVAGHILSEFMGPLGPIFAHVAAHGKHEIEGVTAEEQWKRFTERLGPTSQVVPYADIVGARLLKGIVPSTSLGTKVLCWKSYWLEVSGQKAGGTPFQTYYHLGSGRSAVGLFAKLPGSLLCGRVWQEILFFAGQIRDEHLGDDNRDVAAVERRLSEEIRGANLLGAPAPNEALMKRRFEEAKWEILERQQSDLTQKAMWIKAIERLAPMDAVYRTIPEVAAFLENLAALPQLKPPE
jgi:hypothetical protein